MSSREDNYTSEATTPTGENRAVTSSKPSPLSSGRPDIGSNTLGEPISEAVAHLHPALSFAIQRDFEPDYLAMLAALRVVLGLPKQLPSCCRQDLLSDGQLSNRYTPDRTSPAGKQGRGREDTE